MADEQAPELVDELRALAVQADALRHRLRTRQGRSNPDLQAAVEQAWQGAATAVAYQLMDRNAKGAQ